MGTRSTVTIHAEGKPFVHLYRHLDGYPEENGRDLAKALRRYRRNGYRVDKFGGACAAAWLATDLVRNSDSRGEVVYCLTSDADRHSDRQWHYGISFSTTGEISVDCFELVGHDSRKILSLRGSIPQFRKFIAEALRAQRIRRQASLAKVAPIHPVMVAVAEPSAWGEPAL